MSDEVQFQHENEFNVYFYNLQSQTSGLNQWIEEMDVFLHADDPTNGDLPTLNAQLNESNVRVVMLSYGVTCMTVTQGACLQNLHY